MGRSREFDENDILERATRVFWRKGYNATSMNDLVEATGIAKASIYNAYGSKEKLFQTVLNYYVEHKQSQSLNSLTQGKTAREALEGYFARLLKVTRENKQTPGCLLVNTAIELNHTDETVREIVQKGINRTETHLAYTIKAGIADGSISQTVDANKAALCLVSMILSIRVMARNGTHADRVAQLIDISLASHIPSETSSDEKQASRNNH